MATRDGPGVPRKKTATYGKTSRKRPIHAFLELSNGSAGTNAPRRAVDDAKPSMSRTATTDSGQDPYDPYDMPSDDPEPRPVSRRDAPHPSVLSRSQSDGSGSFKKRKVPATTATKAERKTDSKPLAAETQTAMPSHGRRAKSPFISSSASSEAQTKMPSQIRRAKSSLVPSKATSSRATKTEPVAPAPENPRIRKTPEALPPKSRPPIAAEALHKSENTLQIRQAPLRSSNSAPQPDSKIVRITKTTVESSATKAKKPQPLRRSRLIDQLAAQIEDSTDSESDTSDLEEMFTAKMIRTESSLSTSAMLMDTTTTPKPLVRPKQLLATRKFRSTYGEQRTLRAEESGADSLGSQMGIDGSQNEFSPPPMSQLASFSFEEDDMEEESSSKGGGIIDIHALRQAGANHRFADSMADLIDRVGTPQPPKSQSSRARRTALLELASKLRDKTYVRQFRDQGAKDALFQEIGAEEDLVSGFVLLAVLLVLFTSFSVPHLVPQLEAEGIAQLASSMFAFDEDIVTIASQRKSNLSKNAQASLGALKKTLLELEAWKGSPPAVLSPRILALKVLCVLCKENDGAATQNILASLTDQLFGFVEQGWETSRTQGMGQTEGGLSLSLLESCSIAAMQSETGPRWTKRHLPIVADVLTAAMARPMEQFGEFESTTLKLALNTTNDNPAAASVFSRGELFRELAEAGVAAFGLLQHSIRNGAFSKEVYHTLMLILGVMINTSEHCPSTRESVDIWQARDGSPLDKLMDVYLDNRETAVMADSVEKGSFAVAHGYLAILLGYLSLGAQVRRQLEEKSRGKGIEHLLESISQFMTLHAKVDTDETTTSLQNLVNELRRKHKLSA